MSVLKKISELIIHKLMNVCVVYFQTATVLHPKATCLGLTGEKIVELSACHVRATVWTESGKVTTSVLKLLLLMNTALNSSILIRHNSIARGPA